MKRFVQFFTAVGLLCIGSGAFAQDSNLLAKCLGETHEAYVKAFYDKFTEQKQTPSGPITVSQYKTGSAMIEVIQKSGAKRPEIINIFFYQQPKRDWKLALKDIGLSSEGVTTKEDAKHQVHLTHIKAGKGLKVEGVFIQMDKEHSDGPELHLTLH